MQAEKYFLRLLCFITREKGRRRCSGRLSLPNQEKNEETNMKKRMLSLLLVLCLLLSALPMTALAGEAKLYGTVPIYIGYVDLV